MMNKLSLLGSAMMLVCLTGTALAANLDDATRQKVYATAYQNLSTEQQTCTTPPCGSAMSSAKAESVFNNAYVQVSGKQPSYQEFLEWKYLSDYPADANASQAREVKVTQKSAAVKQAPEGKTTEKQMHKTKEVEKTHMKPEPGRENCGDKK
jgi:hypothetical protein